VRVGATVGLAGARERARELVVFCDGFDEGGAYPEFARRARLVAGDLVEALDELAAERSARVALQARCETQQAILGKRAYDALKEQA
jgi:hypothetical protein